MDENKQQQSVTEGMSGVWVVAVCEGSAGVIGRLVGNEKFGDELKNKVWSKEVVVLKPSFDYYSSPVRNPLPDPQGRGPRLGPDGLPVFVMSRTPIVTGMEFTLEAVPVGVRWTKLFFFDDLSPGDRKVHEEFVEVACKRNLELRTEKLGLIIANAGNGTTAGGAAPHVTADMRDIRKQR